MPQTITVQNHSTKLTEAEFTALVAALREQALEHYNKSTWAPTSETVTDVVRISPEQKPTGWHIELLDISTEEGALGFHEDEAYKVKTTDRSSRGVAAGLETPLAKVFVQTSQEAGVAPSEVASHEMLEMLVDPWVTKEESIRKYQNAADGKYYIAEVGDPVQGEGYATSNGATVANFALPAWWAQPSALVGLPYDYRETRKTPFELAPGGYISVQSPGGQWEQIYGSEGTPAPEPEPTPIPEEPTEEPRPEKEAEEESESEEEPLPEGEPSCQEQLETAEARIEELEALDGKVP